MDVQQQSRDSRSASDRMFGRLRADHSVRIKYTLLTYVHVYAAVDRRDVPEGDERAWSPVSLEISHVMYG